MYSIVRQGAHALPSPVANSRGVLNIQPRHNHPPPNSVEGKTTSECPVCHSSRSRFYTIEGPYTKAEIEAIAAKRMKTDRYDVLIELSPRLSGRFFFQLPLVKWLVSPYAAGRADKYYITGISALCNNESCVRDKPVKVTEREGYRRFGRWGIAWNRLKAVFRRSVVIRPPQ